MPTTKTAALDLDSFAGFTSGDWSADPQANARLIAAAPALLSECKRLRAENERLRDLLRQAADDLLDGDYEIRACYSSELRADLAALEPQS